MGLPMWREPDEEPTERVVSKVDKAAAASRSAIRRASSVRPGRYNAISSPRSRRSIGSLALEDYRARVGLSRPVAESEEAEFEAEIERRRRRRETRSRIRWGSLNENDGNDTDRRQSGEELLRDALHYDRPGQRLRLLRPPRESALRFELAPSPPLPNSALPSTSPRQRRGMPWFDDYLASRIAPDGPLPPTSSVELTPGFAPARGVYHDADLASGEGTSAAIDAAANDGGGLSAIDSPLIETWEASYPPLRRVGHLSPRPYLLRHDGLGDRQRSPGSSVNDSNAEEDTWETLLTTMEEDEHQPSAASSFTSAIASASTSRRSDSASRSGRSSQTTATSFGDVELIDGGQPCESDNDPEEAPELNGLSSTTSMIRRARTLHGMYSPPLPSLSERRLVFERMRNTARETLASVERRSAAAEERLRWIETRAAETEAEVAQMQSLIDEPARRSDMSRQLWPAAGLSRVNRQI